MEITCGRCNSKWAVGVDIVHPPKTTVTPPQINKMVSCPVCGFSKRDIVEAKDNRKVLKD